MRDFSFPKIYKERTANCVLLTVYIFFILVSRIFVTEPFSKIYLAVGSIFLLAFSVIASPIIIHLVSKINLDGQDRFRMIPGYVLKIIFYGLPLLILFICFIAYYPGGFGKDSLAQLEQYVSGQYTDWHPAVQTILVVFIPLRLSVGKIGSIVLVQLIFFSMALGYCFDTIYEYAGRKYLIISMVIVLCNPLLCFALNVWKDVSFAITVMFAVSFALRIYVTGGRWLDKKRNIVFFVVAICFATLFRHNAILFTIPLMLAVLVSISRRKTLIILFLSAVFIGTIKGPFYYALGVTDSPRRQVETVGLPLTVIGSSVSKCPEKLDEDITEFAFEVAPQSIWLDEYIDGNFNSIKWSKYTSFDAIEKRDTSDILDMMARCFKTCPAICISSVIKLTEGVYTVISPHYTDVAPFVVDNYFAIPKISLNSPLLTVIYGINRFVEDYIPFILYIGTYNLAVIAVLLSKVRFNKLRDWKKLLFGIPVLTYNFGSSLLLTGFNDCPRFFCYTVFLVPVLLVFFLRGEKAGE